MPRLVRWSLVPSLLVLAGCQLEPDSGAPRAPLPSEVKPLAKNSGPMPPPKSLQEIRKELAAKNIKLTPVNPPPYEGGTPASTNEPGKSVTEPGKSAPEAGKSVTEPSKTVSEPGKTAPDAGKTATEPAKAAAGSETSKGR